MRPAERPAPPAPPPIPGSFRALLAQRRVVLGDLVDDYLVLRLRPSGERVTMFRAFAALVPAALWTIYFIVLATAYNVGWPVELAVGVGVVSSMMTLILVYLMVPTPVRLIADAPAPVASVVEAPAPSATTPGVNV